MSLVEKIKSLCESKDTTLIGLEREIGLGRGTIRNWDRNSPSIDKLRKVADFFGVSTDQLLKGEPASPSDSIHYRDVSLDLDTLNIMCRIPLLTKNNKLVISDMIESMIRNQE